MPLTGNWEQNVRKVVPYVPGEQPKDTDVIKLNTNENPYPPAPEVRRILDEFNESDMRLYPDPEADVLVSALAENYGLDKSQIFVGVGSDDVIAMAYMTFFNSDKPVLFPDITYSFYDVWAEVFRIPYETKPLTADLRIDPADYICENGGIIFPNPNAPTGVYEPSRSADLLQVTFHGRYAYRLCNGQREADKVHERCEVLRELLHHEPCHTDMRSSRST